LKLTLIGGGGVRSPLFVMTLLRWQKRIGLTELCMLDIDAGWDSWRVMRCGPSCRDPLLRPTPAGLPALIMVTTIAFEQGRATDGVPETRRAGAGDDRSWGLHGAGQHPGYFRVC
jgi:hypothetical protein